jgi:rubrerythrin
MKDKNLRKKFTLIARTERKHFAILAISRE